MDLKREDRFFNRMKKGDSFLFYFKGEYERFFFDMVSCDGSAMKLNYYFENETNKLILSFYADYESGKYFVTGPAIYNNEYIFGVGDVRCKFEGDI